MLRRLEELDRVDREHGLGAMPSSAPPPRRRRRQLGPVLPGLGIVLALLAAVMLRDPGMSGDRLRSLFGLDDRLSSAVEAPAGGGQYRFERTQAGGGQPVTWNPCRPIRYAVNPDGGPDDWQEIVDASVDNVTEATGFVFEYAGTTDDRPFADDLLRSQEAPVVIGWASDDEVPELAGDVAGLGGGVAIETRPGRLGYVRGAVALDTDLLDLLDGQSDAFVQHRALLDHELAHVLGLGHVDDPSELMYADNLGQTGFGPGDLTGLAALGAVPCG